LHWGPQVLGQGDVNTVSERFESLPARRRLGAGISSAIKRGPITVTVQPEGPVRTNVAIGAGAVYSFLRALQQASNFVLTKSIAAHRSLP
jgi:hypothetical protein